MSQVVYNPPFDDLDSLYQKTNLKILVLKGSAADITFAVNKVSTIRDTNDFTFVCFQSSFSMPIFGRLRRSNRLKVLSNLEDLYEKVCLYSNKYVMFDSEDSVALRGATICRVSAVGAAYYLTPVASGVSRGFAKKKIIDIGYQLSSSSK